MVTAHSTNEKNLTWEAGFLFLVINSALVIIGYGLSVYTNGASLPVMKFIKVFFLSLSFIFLFKDMKLNKNSIPFPNIMYIMIFSFWFVLMAFLTKNVGYSLEKCSNFLFPFLYIYITLHNLLNKYEVMTILRVFTKAMNLVYAIPLLSYLLFVGSFRTLNIYGSFNVFVSNQYGWASCVFLLTSLDILLNMKPRRLYRLFLISFSTLALFLVLISGNRSSWLSLIIAIIILIFRLKKLRLDFKIGVLIVPVLAITWMLSIPASSLNQRINVTQTQLNVGEAREKIAEAGFEKLNENKILWVTGAGMFNYKGFLPELDLADYHDSYLEILFGGGIILFFMFISFMVIRPLKNYILYYSKIFVILPPFLIIPFFESNLTGGQFLFFPWFAYMLLFNIKPPEGKLQRKNSTAKKKFPTAYSAAS